MAIYTNFMTYSRKLVILIVVISFIETQLVFSLGVVVIKYPLVSIARYSMLSGSYLIVFVFNALFFGLLAKKYYSKKMKKCSNCGEETTADKYFCGNCGERFPL